MATTVTAFIEALSRPRSGIMNSGLVAGGATGVTTQAGATKILGEINRFDLVSGAGYSAVLPELITEEFGAGILYVINNTPTNAMSVFCALGNTLNGSTNGSLSIAAGAVGVFVRKDRTDSPYTAPDWRAGAIT